jgi:SH3-like domain-containing protein
VFCVPVKSFRPYLPLLATALVLLTLAIGCKRRDLSHHEYMYVSAAETSLRDRVATMYNKLGTVHNGDRVEVLEKQRRFLRVRTDSGQEGWIEERSLAPQEIYDGFHKLAQDNANMPVQAHGTTRAELNIHLTPSRDAEHLYQLKDGEKVEILKRATAEKNPPKAPSTPKPQAANNATTPANAPKPGSAAPATPPSKAKAPAAPQAAAKTKAAGDQPAPKTIMEDWYLVRSSSGHAGWVLLRMVDLDIPVEVAQYAEGQRIVGYFVLNTVLEDDKPQAQYLVLLNEPKDGLAWDYNQIRIFTRNRAKHRYETAYRERNLEGYLPVQVGHRDFGKEGDLPIFTIRKMNDDGQIVEVTYKLNGPIVKRVLSPEEEAAEKTKHDAALAARMKEIAARRAQHPQSAPKHAHHKHQ